MHEVQPQARLSRPGFCPLKPFACLGFGADGIRQFGVARGEYGELTGARAHELVGGGPVEFGPLLLEHPREHAAAANDAITIGLRLLQQKVGSGMSPVGIAPLLQKKVDLGLVVCAEDPLAAVIDPVPVIFLVAAGGFLNLPGAGHAALDSVEVVGVFDAHIVELGGGPGFEPVVERTGTDAEAVQQRLVGAGGFRWGGQRRHRLKDEPGAHVAGLHASANLGQVLVPHEQRARERKKYPLDGAAPVRELGEHLDQFPGEGQRRFGQAQLLGELAAREQEGGGQVALAGAQFFQFCVDPDQILHRREVLLVVVVIVGGERRLFLERSASLLHEFGELGAVLRRSGHVHVGEFLGECGPAGCRLTSRGDGIVHALLHLGGVVPAQLQGPQLSGAIVVAGRVARGIRCPAVVARFGLVSAQHGAFVVGEAQGERVLEWVDQAAQPVGFGASRGGRFIGVDGSLEHPQMLGLLAQLHYVLVGLVQFAKLLDGGCRPFEGAGLVEHEGAKELIETTQVLCRLGLVQQVQRILAADAEQAAQLGVERAVRPRGRDDSVGPGRLQSAGLDSARHELVEVAQADVAAVDEAGVLQIGLVDAGALEVEHPRQGDGRVAFVVEAQQHPAPGGARPNV